MHLLHFQSLSLPSKALHLWGSYSKVRVPEVKMLRAGLWLLPLPARGRHREVNKRHGAGTTGLEKTLVSIPWGKRATNAPDKLGFAFSKGFRLRQQGKIHKGSQAR